MTKKLREIVSLQNEDSFFGEMFLDETLDYLEEKKIADMSPAEHKNMRYNEAEGIKWHEDHPVHHQNIIDHYNKATDEEKHVGHNWYSDAHKIAKSIADTTKTPMHTMAGLIANYSPQTHWYTNIHTASQVALHKKPIGGAGSGVMASTRQKTNAEKMLGGEHYDNVLKGQKIRHFAHLIEHGGNADPNDTKVAIDRHAHSVASGARITDAGFGVSKLKNPKRYETLRNAYIEAAKHLSQQHGTEIHPHQVQATTWLVRQRLNNDEEKTGKTKKAAASEKKKWDDHAAKYFPDVVGKVPGAHL